MPFKEDLDRCPIDVGADKYVDHHGPNPEYTSLISAQVTVPAASTTLAALLLAAETTETAEVIDVGETGVAVYSGTVAPHPVMKIVAGTFEITIPVAVGDVTLTDGGVGVLANGADVGTIDYETGAWTVTADSTVEDGENVLVTYDWSYVVPTATPAQALWVTPGAADEIFSTWSEDGVPTAATGILISEAMYIAGQPDMIENSKFFGSNTLMDVEVLI